MKIDASVANYLDYYSIMIFTLTKLFVISNFCVISKCKWTVQLIYLNYSFFGEIEKRKKSIEKSTRSHESIKESIRPCLRLGIEDIFRLLEAPLAPPNVS